MKISNLAEKLYQKLPNSIQTLALNIEGYRIQKRRYGASFKSKLIESQERLLLSKNELKRYQAEKLENHFINATKTKFWSEQFNLHNIRLNSSNPFHEVSKLPLLTKDTVKANRDSIVNPEIPKENLLPVHTSGSTGSGLRFWQTRDAEQETWAIWWRYRTRFSLSNSHRCAYWGGRTIVQKQRCTPPYWKNNHFGKQLIFSAYHLNESTLPSYINALERYNPQWLHGYPSFLSQFAGLCREHNLIPTLPALEIISTGSENLLDFQRQKIESVFGVRIIQNYGQAEAVANFSQCEKTNNLIVDEDYSLVEFEPINGQSNSAKIIGTNWGNPAFPLFRYDTRDIATINQKANLQWREVSFVDGRQEDYLTLPDNTKIGRLDHIFKDIESVKEAQFVQEVKDSVLLMLVTAPSYDFKVEKQIISELVSRLGHDLQINIRKVKSIPRTKSGKLRFVVSKVS